LKDRIVAYNLDDCHALRRLVCELRSLGEAATSRLDVDFSDRPKQHATLIGTSIHDSLEGILKSAHAEYDKNRIGVGQQREGSTTGRNVPGGQQGHVAYKRIMPSKVSRIVPVRRKLKCPKHKTDVLEETDQIAERTLIDLKFTGNGCRKTATKFIGRYSYCRDCKRRFAPPSFGQVSGLSFGHGFRAWVVYQRISLRLPYRPSAR
jgi:hypothetical protein